jgi:hypothetical protein
MPVHDWTRVEAGIYHDFHVAWIAEIRKALNGGVLPNGYYALAEQHAGQSIADVLTLHASAPRELPSTPAPATGGIALIDAPPQVSRREAIPLDSIHHRRRTLAIRHVSGHRLVAIVEILSPGNKERVGHLDAFTEKIVSAIEAGVHVLLVDLFPPGPFDPSGIHDVLRQYVNPTEGSYEMPIDAAGTLVAYAAGARVEVFLEHVFVGAKLSDMPLFLRPDSYVNVPLEATYLAAYEGMPGFYRDILEAAE